MTIRINHAPIFRALVAFTLAGEGEESCRFTFRHKTPAALIEWRKTIGTRPAHESMAEIVEGWEGVVDEDDKPVPYSPAALKSFLEAHSTRAEDLAKGYLYALTESRVKNSHRPPDA